MNKWDEAAIQRGLNPYIGTEIASELVKAGFNAVDTKFWPVIAMGGNRQKYTSIINNLAGFYMGPAADQFELAATDSDERINADRELKTFGREDFVMDALFAAWGS